MTLRSPRDEEAAAVAQVLARELPDELSPEFMTTVWSAPRFDRERDARVALSPEGEVVGYADAETVGDNRRKAWLFTAGEPARELMEWAERRASELVEPPARIGSSVWSENDAGRRLLEERGFRLVRHFYRMAIDLGPEPSEPSWPDGIVVRTFQPGDERTFYEVHQETFEDHWEHVRRAYDEWAHWFLAPERHVPDLWFLAVDGDEPAGVAMCHPDEMRPGMAWVGILGVRRSWRRRGLARALLLQAFHEFRRRGFAEAVLGVDAESLTGAVRLYEAAGMHVVHRFDAFERELDGA